VILQTSKISILRWTYTTHTCTPQDFLFWTVSGCVGRSDPLSELPITIGTSEVEVPRGSVSNPRNKYMFRHCVGTSGLRQKFRSNVPSGSGGCSEACACSDELSELPTHVGSSGVDPPRGSVSVPTHNYMFWRTIRSSKPGSSNLNSVSLSKNVGRSDALSEVPSLGVEIWIL